MWCTICGCPVRPPPRRPSELEVEEEEEESEGEGAEQQQEDEEEDENSPLKWLWQAVMLSDPAEEFETLEQHYRAGKKPGVPELEFTRDDEEIRVDKVTMTTAEECILEKNGTRILPNWGIGLDETGALHPSSVPYGIVVHAACFEIAERVMRKSRRPSVRVRSSRALWKVLRMRRDAFDNELMGKIVWPTRYPADWETNFYYMFIDPAPWRGRDWRHPWRDNHGEWLLEDPTTAPDLTALLLSAVKPVELEAANPETKAFRKRFLSLPLELQQHILLLLSSGDGLHMCTRLLPQEVWRDLLLGREFLPFLHDIDDAAVLRSAQETGEERRETTEIDWERLVVILSAGAWVPKEHQGPIWRDWDPSTGYYYCDSPAPTGLRNRRRIWQLVEEMFVGDLLPSKGSGASVPRYWNEYGERVYPVIRQSG